MTIIFVIDQVYLHGGIERVLSIKANYLANDSNNRVYIITTEQKKHETCYYFNESIVFIDLDINYQRTKSYFHPVNLLKVPKHFIRVKKRIKNIKPDMIVVCSHSTDTFFLPFMFKKVPKIKEFHFSKHIEEEKRKNPKNQLRKYFLKFSDYVESRYDRLIVLNIDEKKYYKTDNVSVIPNPVTFFPKSKAALRNKIAIAAGRIAPVKGFDLLIDIWEIIASKNLNWQLHIYGEGQESYVYQLQEKISSKGLNDTVFLKGPTNSLDKKMLDASLYVMSSHNECFPLVLLEAQSCGLPIISYDCPNGPRNIITKKTGILIEPYDSLKYANELLHLVSDHELLTKMGNNARQNAKRYSIEKIMKKWIALFNEIESGS